MNLPNALTVIRILLIPLFLYKVLQGNYTFAFWVFLTAAITDGLDGFIAKVWNMQTRLGTFLDPMADKLLITTSYVSLAFLKIVPLWLSIAVISRDIIIVSGSVTVYHLTGHLDIKPRMVSKATTFFQFLTIVWALLIGAGVAKKIPSLVPYFNPLALITGSLTIVSGVVYILAGFRSLEE